MTIVIIVVPARNHVVHKPTSCFTVRSILRGMALTVGECSSLITYSESSQLIPGRFSSVQVTKATANTR